MRPRRDVFKEIERGEWTHIYLGPEMVMHKGFGNLLVLEWPEFRPAFLEIQHLRHRFEGRVVWLALSATVEPVDRQSIVLAPRFLQYPASDTEFLDFAWAVPLAANTAAHAPAPEYDQGAHPKSSREVDHGDDVG